MTGQNLLPKEMFEHYQQIKESDRLSVGVGELERVRTQDIISRYLPRPPATILDVEGAAGVHALWLSKKGYEVHLSDPVSHHVEQAQQASALQPDFPIASCSIGDARAINRPNNSTDAVLLLGPLYHLVNHSERLEALKEVHRVLKSGGLIFAATVSRFASLLDGLSRDLVADHGFIEIIRQDLKNGQHRNPTGDPGYFTTTFFHHPEDLKSELIAAGFKFEKIVGVEGPVWFMPTFVSHWSSPEKREVLLGFLRTIEEDPYILGASAHPLGIARK